MVSSTQTKQRIAVLLGLARAHFVALVPALLVALAIVGWPPAHALADAGRRIEAVYRDGALVVTVPLETGRLRPATLDLEVLDPNDTSIARRSVTIPSGASRREWIVAVPIPRSVPLEDLAWERLKIDTGTTTRIVSISEILSVPVVRLFAQRSYAVSSPASARVIATSSRTGNPLRGSTVRLDLLDGARATSLFTGRTDSLGTVEAKFRLPRGSFGPRTMRLTAVTPLGTVTSDQPVQLERRDRILLTTDKPIYQPGQTMHLRALALEGASRAAAGDQPIVLEVEDGKGNKVFRQRGRTDRFGIASADFELADEVNFGPYHIRAILGEEGTASTQEKTVTVDRYTLPKFKVEVRLRADEAGPRSAAGAEQHEARYYAPGETVEGKVTATYLFGKPVSNADVTVRLSTFDVAAAEIARVPGRTDGEGRFSFSAKLPDFLAGRSTEQGSAPVSIAVDVKDTAQHMESRSRDILVSNTPILIMAVPESGSLLPGLENRVYLLTSYPDGAPARTTISGNITPSSVETDDSGVATIAIREAIDMSTLNLSATDARGRTAKARIVLETRNGSQSLRLRADRAVYKVGDTVRLETLSTKPRGAVYIDVVKDGQTLITRAVESTGGRAALAIDLTPEMFGAVEVRAYQITADADPILDRRLIYVDPADDLEVTVAADRKSYKPGDEARIDFRVTDSAGRPVAAALGIEVVDEAVFALSDRHPGFEKVFLYLEKELLTPRYEVHQLSFDQVMRDEFAGPEPARIARRDRAAQVLFAAAGTVGGRDVRAELGRQPIESKRGTFQILYAQRVQASAQTLAAAMTEFYQDHRPSREGFDRDVKSFTLFRPAVAKTLLDPWGRPLVGQGTVGDRAQAVVILRSLGPDGVDRSADDMNVQIYALRRRPGSPGEAPFKGSASSAFEVVAGGRVEIRGAVRDEAGSPLGTIKVTARLRADGKTTQVYTDRQGRFTLSNLKPGVYDVVFENDGFLTTRKQWLVLDSGTRVAIDAVLRPSSSATPLLTIAGLRGDGPVDDQELARPEMIAALGYVGAPGAPGVMGGVPGGVAGGILAGVMGRPAKAAAAMPEPMRLAEARAARERDFKATIDSVDNVDPLTGTFKSNLSPPTEIMAFQKKEKGDGDAPPRVRSFFPETLYTNPALITDGTGRASIRVPIADSITTWRVTSLASTEHGALGSSTAPIKVFKDFFIDLDLPVAVTQGDLVSVPVAVYNYLPTAQRVSLELREDPWFALDGDVAGKQVDVGAGEVGVAYFRIRASSIGTQQIQVTARLESGVHLKNGAADGALVGGSGDSIARSVDVRPDGEEHSIVVNDRLERDAAREIVIPQDAIPEASKLFVRFYPGALSQVIEGLDSILQMPGGCFEQTSSSTYPNVLVLDYLKTSKKITPEIQAKAEQYVALGYQRLVTFEVPGGGFSWFGQAPANKILTAYGLMEFSDMSRVHEVDPRLIERTQSWLARQQQSDGSFKPDASFINEGATNRYNSDAVRITAYIGWALSATGYKGEAVDKARAFVASHVTGKEDAYTAAVIANFAAQLDRTGTWTGTAIDALAAKVTEQPKTAWWKQEGETPTSAREESADVETTALAAQALLKSGRKGPLAKKALDFLASKKNSSGNWSTTQATILSLRAFLMSFTNGQSADAAGTIEVSVDGKAAGHVEITKENSDLLRTVDLKIFTHDGAHRIGLSFTGRGSVQYQIVGRYYMPWTQRADAGARGPLSIDIAYDRTRLAQDERATATVRVRNNTSAAAKMIMVDLGIPPGFEPAAEDFAALVDRSRNQTGGKLEKYTITAKQAILYFDGLAPNQTVEFSFGLRAKFPVRAKTFSSRVYEYYNPTVEARTKPLELTIVSR